MTFRRSRKLVFWALAAWLAGGGPPMPCWADGPAAGTAVGTFDGMPSRVLALVRGYLGERGISSLTQTQIQPEDLVVASPPPSGAEILVSRGRWDALRHEYQVYLRCSNPKECRPFLVAIHIKNKEAPAALPGLASAGSAFGSLAGAGTSERASRTTPPRKESPPLVRVGEHVELRLAGPGVRIRLEAICLEPGILGQQVRARGVGQARVFRARVEGPRQLAMEFE